MRPTVRVPEQNRFATVGQVMGVSSLLLPFMAVPGMLCGFAGWIKSLLRPSIPGRWPSVRAIVASLALAPVGVVVIGNYWAHRASNLTDFGSGTQVHSIPIVAPGAGYTLVSSHSGSDAGAPTPTTSVYPDLLSPPGTGGGEQVFVVTNQTSATAWANADGSEGRETLVVLSPSPGLARSIFSGARNALAGEPDASAFPVPALPGAVGVEVSEPGVAPMQAVMAERGSVTVLMWAFGAEPVQQVRAATEHRMAAQLGAVPARLAKLDAAAGSYEHRHNAVRRVLEDMLVADAPLLAVFLALAVVTLLVEAGRRAAKPRGTPARGWYADPTGRFSAREWTGRKWSSQIVHNGRRGKDRLETGPAGG